MVTQQEITQAYLDGTDIRDLYRRRLWSMVALLALPSFFLLYVIKSALGIDLFSFHLWDLIP